MGLSVQTNENLFCEVAGSFFQSLKASIPEGQELNINELIKEVCSTNPIFSAMCETLILPNLEQFSDLIKTGDIKLEGIIEVVDHHCASVEQQLVQARAEVIVENDVAVETIQTDVMPEIKPCETCLFFMSFLQNEIGDDLSEENIGHYLNGTCDQFEIGKKYCKRIVTENFDALVSLIQKKSTPAGICTFDFKFCDSDFWETDFSQSSFKCELCEFIIDYVYRKIGNEHNMQKIEQVLQNVCNILPLGKDLCKEMISHFLPQLKEYLMNRYSPNFICGKIKMCNTLYYEKIQEMAAIVVVKEYIEEHPFEVQAFGSSSECQFCQWTVSAVQSWLSDGHTQTEIALFLNQLCNFFGSYAPQCEQLVRVYVPKLIDSIIEKQNPPLVCSNLGVCKV